MLFYFYYYLYLLLSVFAQAEVCTRRKLRRLSYPHHSPLDASDLSGLKRDVAVSEGDFS